MTKQINELEPLPESIKRINVAEQLPEWFKLERYEALLSLNVFDFIMQIDFRAEAYDERFVEDDLNKIAEKIIVPVHMKGPGDYWYSGRCDMATSGAVASLNNFDLCVLDAVARKKGIYGMTDGQDVSDLDRFDRGVPNKQQAFKAARHPLPGRLPVMLKLNEKSDDEILADLAALLPLWRAETKTPEPALNPEEGFFELPTLHVGLSVLKRAVEYKAIPMIDLMLWELVENVRITDELMAEVLFPDHSRGGQHIAQTLRPFAKDLVSGGCMVTRTRKALEKNRHIYGWVVSDFMEWRK
ncbi:DUF6387 family protein [Oceanimonas baumannii]|nr:DUF6387 family protein [Oceanimonas baumannii]TDW61217.1 hypothetical protein LY04_00749 [Oceanimonas baumannii]